MKLVILDRDGVINYDSDVYIKSPEEWIPIPGSLEAIARLTQSGFTVTVATNQSGVARGLFDRATLESIHRKMTAAAEAKGGRLAGIFYCPHGPDDRCDCRKPKPGLLRQIEKHFGQSLTDVPSVGDSLRDLQAAQAVNARPILVCTGKGKETLQQMSNNQHVEVFADLAATADFLIQEQRR